MNTFSFIQISHFCLILRKLKFSRLLENLPQRHRQFHGNTCNGSHGIPCGHEEIKSHSATLRTPLKCILDTVRTLTFYQLSYESLTSESFHAKEMCIAQMFMQRIGRSAHLSREKRVLASSVRLYQLTSRWTDFCQILY